MQLIQLNEPSIDIKKTMSTLEEAFEPNQIIGAVADIEDDICAKTSLTKTEISTVEDVNRENVINEQIDDTAKNLNGVFKTNGDAQKKDKTLALKHNKIETEETKSIKNGTPMNDQNNESSSENIFRESPSSVPAEDHFKEKLTTASKEGLNVEMDLAKIPDDLFKADVCTKQASDNNELKAVSITIESENVAQNVQAFSPNSDTNEKEVNIASQLQQLENDESMQEEIVYPITNTKNINSVSNTSEQVSELNSKNLGSPDEEHINENLSTEEKSENHDDITCLQQNIILDSPIKRVNVYVDSACAVFTEKPFIKQNETMVPEKNLESTSTEDTHPTKANLDDCDISDNSNATNHNLTAAIKNQSEENSKKNSSEIKMKADIEKPILEEKNEINVNEDSDVHKESSEKKYITVKKFTDMTYTVAQTSETVDNCKAIAVSNEKLLIEKGESNQNEVMEVDETNVVSLDTPENSSSSDTCFEKPLVEKKIETEKAADTETTTTEKQQMAVEQNESNNVVMEINDVEEVSVIKKPSPDIEVVKNKVIAEIKETPKYDSVINIVDNDDEDNNDALIDSKSHEMSEVITINDSSKDAITEEPKKPSDEVEAMDVEVPKVKIDKKTKNEEKPWDKNSEKTALKQLPIVCKLSNTMDILSDEEDDPPVKSFSDENKSEIVEELNKCINIDDDDDIMFIEDTNCHSTNDENKSEPANDNNASQTKTDDEVATATDEDKISSTDIFENKTPKICDKDNTTSLDNDIQSKVEEAKDAELTEKNEAKPLITKSFLKSVTKNLADMTRNELEDFCILKLVESVVDKSNLSEIKNKMKTMAQTVEELRKKALTLTKQNRDLQVVVKTVQEDQKKRSANPMMPMKITRSVGMQVVLSAGEKSILKKKLTTTTQPPHMVATKPIRNMQSPKTQKPIVNNIPVPRLVPASSPTVKSPVTQLNTTTKNVATTRNTTPQRPEKRPHSKPSPSSSVTVDLTDDEPPAKINTKSPAPPVRLVPSQNLMPQKTRPQFGATGNSPRKVYIPISSNNQNMRPSQTVMRNFVSTPRPRQPSVVRMQTVRFNQSPTNRHPAPLPDAMKQYQPPTWKSLPPAPDLKLSKVDNGIVISWKFEGYQPDTYEEVASFQLYAYQETPAPPSTALWKKIGDIKALPLPMACTLTQFMSGFKYYFAVRAIDVRSRIGPFSLPGSIMLISKS